MHLTRRSAGKREAAKELKQDTAADDNSLVTQQSQPCALPVEEADLELELCLQLREWDPWAEPSQELMSAIDALSKHDVNRFGKGTRCCLRAATIGQLVRETNDCDQMPEWMRYHACARYNLQTGRATALC